MTCPPRGVSSDLRSTSRLGLPLQSTLSIGARIISPSKEVGEWDTAPPSSQLATCEAGPEVGESHSVVKPGSQTMRQLTNCPSWPTGSGGSLVSADSRHPSARSFVELGRGARRCGRSCRSVSTVSAACVDDQLSTACVPLLAALPEESQEPRDLPLGETLRFSLQAERG